MNASGICESDMCPIDLTRHTTLHLLWECKAFELIRRPYLDEIRKVLKAAEKKGKEVKEPVEKMLDNNAFRHTGIAQADAEAAKYAAEKSLEIRRRLIPVAQDMLLTKPKERRLFSGREGSTCWFTLTDPSRTTKVSG